MSGILGADAGVARGASLQVPAHWRQNGAGMLLPQGSVIANWVLATMSSPGINSLMAAPSRPEAAGGQQSGRRSPQRLDHLCRALGRSDSDRFFRALLVRHFTGESA